MATQRLITVQQVKDGTPIDANIQSKQIELAIDYAQDFRLQHVIGSDLYAKMQADFGGYAGDYLTLYNTYIKPYLLHRVVADVLPIIHYQAKNKGVMEMSSLDGNHAGLKEMQLFVQDFINKSQQIASQMQDWLCSVNIPEYTNSQDAGGVSPTDRTYESTIFDGNTRGGNPNSSLISRYFRGHWE